MVTADSWLRATFALAMVHAAVLATVHARPGLIAVVLWYIEPPLVALAAAVLLAVALLRSRRALKPPTAGQLAGYLTLAALVGSLVAFRTYPSSFDDRPSDVRFVLPLDGPVTVGWGGPTPTVNYHASIPDQRWADHLLVTDINPADQKPDPTIPGARSGPTARVSTTTTSTAARCSRQLTASCTRRTMAKPMARLASGRSFGPQATT